LRIKTVVILQRHQDRPNSIRIADSERAFYVVQSLFLGRRRRPPNQAAKIRCEIKARFVIEREVRFICHCRLLNDLRKHRSRRAHPPPQFGPFAQIELFQAMFQSEEHTSELQSLTNLVCRLLLEKKKKK